MADSTSRRSRWLRRATLPLILLAALVLRLVAVAAVQLYTQAEGVLGVFGDSAIYWQLAGTIREGAPYVVDQWGVPHFALRTPGYPALLALCQSTFGPDDTLAARLSQAVLGTVGVGLLYGLVRAVLSRDATGEPHRGRARAVAAIAAAIAAVEPYTVGMSALLLSEALFVPLMTGGLWGLAALWRPKGGGASDRPGRSVALAIVTGATIGAALLSRPSWAAFLALALPSWVLVERSARALRLSAVVALAIAATMAPWWLRNGVVLERFVPTALWVGASLYDGLNPQATGASDMGFLEGPDIIALDEVEQDEELRRRAMRFAAEEPGRALRLAAIKVGRFWSPWPNADELNWPGVAALSAVATLPVFGLLLVGLWDRRRDPRALVLLGGGLLAFCLLHAVFVGSIRYRLPGMVPAFGLAAAGGVRLLGGRVSRAGREARRMAAWAIVSPIAAIVGGGWYAVNHATDSAELVELIEQESVLLLPGSATDVRRVRLKPFGGSATLDQVTVDQGIEGLDGPTLKVGWLELRFDFWQMLHGRFEPRRVVVAQPTLRLGRRPDGSWNLRGLLADPWPLPKPERLPRVLVRNGKLLLDDDGGDGPAAALLREVEATLEPLSGSAFRFEATARGDGFERLRLAGTLDIETGRLALTGGQLDRLELDPALARRLPSEWRPVLAELGIRGGVADVIVHRLRLDPAEAARLGPSAIEHDCEVRLRSGTWDCPKLPFPLNDVELVALIRDGRVAIRRARGTNGRTVVRAKGTLDALEPMTGPLELWIDALDLELDDRLRDKMPPEHRESWDEFAPEGRINAYLYLVRGGGGGEPDVGLTIDCKGVSIRYAGCPYPLEQLEGRLVWQGGALGIGGPPVRTDQGWKVELVDRLTTVIGNRPAYCWGTVEDPGPGAVVALELEMGALPIDATLMHALPPEIEAVVREFEPRGTVAVRRGRIDRRPPPEGSDREVVEFAAELALGEPADGGGFSFKWVGLPYPVSGVTGTLSLSPDLWTFGDLAGSNGTARLSGDGWVRHRGGDQYDLDLQIVAEDLPFDRQLREALPREWQDSWAVLDPRGNAALHARVRALDGEEHTTLTVVPGEDTRVKLRVAAADPGAAGPEVLELPAMDDVEGTFVYRDGDVSMRDVRFDFRGAEVRFPDGSVRVEDSGGFDLDVTGLQVRRFRLDAELRRLMPSLMADFARRLDESPPLPLMSGDLHLGWSGRPGEPTVVEWGRGLVILNGQTIRAGIPLESIQGQFGDFAGTFDGQSVNMSGLIEVDSMSIAGQQITGLVAPLEIVEGREARVERLGGSLLGGALTGRLRVGLDERPEFAASLALRDADLARFTATLPGRQDFRGRLRGQLSLRGVGTDLRSITGEGDFHIDRGDLGELPAVLRLFKFLNTLDVTAPSDDTAFDSADVSVRIADGLAHLRPIKLTGDAISLRGGGTMDFRGELDLTLRLIYGRNGLRIPLLSPAVREAGGQIVDIRVRGPASFPHYEPEVLPRANELFRSFGSGALRALGPGRRVVR